MSFDFDGGGGGRIVYSGNMRWLQRVFPPRSWPFIIFAFILAVVLAGGAFYRGILKRRDLAHPTTAIRRTFVDNTKLPEMKLERSALEFQLAALPGKFPVLTNAALKRDWLMSAGLARLDPDVDAAWNSYWKRISPPVLQADHRLKYFLALQSAYDTDADRLIRDWSVTNKSAALLDLQTTKFASLFTNQVYLDDRARFEAAAAKITDPQTLDLREAYRRTLVPVITALNPKLVDYGRAALVMESKATEINRQLNLLNEQLRDLGELPEPSTGEQVGRPVPVCPPERPSSREYFKTYVPQPRDFAIIETAIFVVGFLITLPPELRSRRWLKIGASLVLVYFELLILQVQVSVSLAERYHSIFAYLIYLLPATLLAAIWTHDLCSIGANLAMYLIDSPGTGRPPVSHHRSPRLAIRQGDLADALRLARARLTADSHVHYETLVLKAKLHQQMNHKWRAKWALKKARRDLHLTDDQRRYVNLLLSLLDDPSHHCWKL
jgi:hypothetical protein